MLQIVNIIGNCACYCLVCIFYLAAFYAAMLKKPLIIRGMDPLQHLRFEPKITVLFF